MNINITTAGVILSSFTTGLVPSQVPTPAARAWCRPGDAVFELLNKAAEATRAGEDRRAKALEAEAERLFQLVA
jgi:hypothetical protein